MFFQPPAGHYLLRIWTRHIQEWIKKATSYSGNLVLCWSRWGWATVQNNNKTEILSQCTSYTLTLAVSVHQVAHITTTNLNPCFSLFKNRRDSWKHDFTVCSSTLFWCSFCPVLCFGGDSCVRDEYVVSQKKQLWRCVCKKDVEACQKVSFYSKRHLWETTKTTVKSKSLILCYKSSQTQNYGTNWMKLYTTFTINSSMVNCGKIGKHSKQKCSTNFLICQLCMHRDKP